MKLFVVLIVVTVAIPLVALAAVGWEFEEQVHQWIESTLSPGEFAAGVVSILALDVFLPVPSSFVSTLAGSRLGIIGGTLASWGGMSLGGIVAFALARTAGSSRLGRHLVSHAGETADWQRLQGLAEQRGGLLLCVTRALPVIAEAAVLLVGALQLPWRRFLPPLLLANLGLSLAYAALGHFAYVGDSLVIAAVASIVVPLGATWAARRFWPSDAATK